MIDIIDGENAMPFDSWICHIYNVIFFSHTHRSHAIAFLYVSIACAKNVMHTLFGCASNEIFDWVVADWTPTKNSILKYADDHVIVHFDPDDYGSVYFILSIVYIIFVLIKSKQSRWSAIIISVDVCSHTNTYISLVFVCITWKSDGRCFCECIGIISIRSLLFSFFFIQSAVLSFMLHSMHLKRSTNENWICRERTKSMCACVYVERENEEEP